MFLSDTCVDIMKFLELAEVCEQSLKNAENIFKGIPRFLFNVDHLKFKETNEIAFTEKVDGKITVYINPKILLLEQYIIKKIIAHELAHAICMRDRNNNGHDMDWRYICRKLRGFEETNFFNKILTEQHSFYIWSIGPVNIYLTEEEHKTCLVEKFDKKMSYTNRKTVL